MTYSLESRQLPPLKDLAGVAGPLYGFSSQSLQMGARFGHWDTITSSRAPTPLSPPLDISSRFGPETYDRPVMLGTKHLRIVDSRERATTIPVPVAAERSAGGWFDPSRWLFKLVFEKIGDKSIEELVKLMFYREARPRYGEDHTSTRAKRTEQVRTDRSDPPYGYTKQTSSDLHKQQEQDRRWRHRTLQYETDECTGTYVCETAEQMLPLIKETINQMPREDINVQDSDRKVKRLGKDEQLTAAALLPHISSILIFKLYDALDTLKSKFRQKEDELQQQREHRMHLEYQLSQLQRENERLKDKISYVGLERPSSSRKRSAASLDGDSAYETDHPPRIAKRQRPDYTSQMDGRLNRCLLPLSPQSEGDEFAASSFTTSYSSA